MPAIFQKTKDEVSDGVCPEGPHSAQIADTKLEESQSSGRPMMVTEFVVDQGEAKGERVVHRFVFETPSSFGERQLKDMCEHIGFEWETADSWDEWVEQFQGLRVGIKVSHRYSYEKSDGQYEEVDAETWESLDDTKYTKYRNAEIDGFFAPEGEPEVEIGTNGEADKEKEEAAPF